MATRYVNEGGSDTSPYDTEAKAATALNTALTGASASDVIEITGTWTSADSTACAVSAAVTIKCTGSAIHPGYPNRSSPTHYRHKVASGHAFTVSADVALEDIDIESDSTGVSDEIFRVSSAASITCKRCLIGFSGNTDQQDVLYTDVDGATETFTFEQCQFHDVGRSIVDLYQAGSTITVEFNSCASFNISANGGRSAGSWVGVERASGMDVTVNAHNCLMHVSPDTSPIYLFSASAPGTGTFTVNCTYGITNLSSFYFSHNTDGTPDSTGMQYSHTWADSSQGAGNYVILRDVTTTPYDQRLPETPLTNANNEAENSHTVATDAGLTIPATDIVGTARPGSGESEYCVGTWEYPVAGGGGAGHPWFYIQQQMQSMLALPVVLGLLRNPALSRRDFIKYFPWAKK